LLQLGRLSVVFFGLEFEAVEPALQSFEPSGMDVFARALRTHGLNVSPEIGNRSD
jgi:hypothetical protein